MTRDERTLYETRVLRQLAVAGEQSADALAVAALAGVPESEQRLILHALEFEGRIHRSLNLYLGEPGVILYSLIRS